jgi:two-component system chemotaxis response regulator CheB
MGRPLRVLIVDDSALMRHRLSGIIGAAPGYEVAGRAANGEECLAQLPTLQPDVVTLDVEMPGMDGLTTLRHIMAARPTPTIMVSSLTEAGARTTLDALSLGAVDYLTKPASGTLDRTAAFRDELLRKLAMAATARLPRVVPGTLRLAPVVSRPSVPAGARGRARALVVIGSSTGGPQALDHLFGSLSPDLAATFLVVQHMPPLFTRSLAARLERRNGMSVHEGEEGELLAPGQVLVAPGGSHLTIGRDHRIHLDAGPPIHGVRPAIDRTLASVAECWRGPCMVVILTGMGVDGAAGARALRGRGADVVAQDEETSVVYGMPRAVVAARAASAVLPLADIAPAIEHWAASRTGVTPHSEERGNTPIFC